MTARPRAARAPRPARRARAVALLALAAPALAACSVTNAITTYDDAPVTSGVQVDLGHVRGGDVLVVANADGSAGAVVGYLTNSGTDTAQVAVATADGGPAATTVRVPAGATVLLGPDHQSLVVADVGAPGGVADLTFTVEGGRTATVPAPVLDGTFPQFADLVPNGG